MDRFYRADGYSTDGFFLIKTELENAYLKRQKGEESGPRNMQYIVDKATNGMFTKLVKVEDSQLNDIPVIKYKDLDDTFNVVIARKFLWYFRGLKNLTLETEGSFSPITVRSNDEFVGIIMPIKVAQ